MSSGGGPWPSLGAGGRTSQGKRPPDPQADTLVPDVADERYTDRGAEEVRMVAPATAADDAPLVTARPRRTVGGRTVVVSVPAVLDPLLDIAVDLEQAPWIGLERIDRQRLWFWILA